MPNPDTPNPQDELREKLANIIWGDPTVELVYHELNIQEKTRVDQTIDVINSEVTSVLDRLDAIAGNEHFDEESSVLKAFIEAERQKYQ